MQINSDKIKTIKLVLLALIFSGSVLFLLYKFGVWQAKLYQTRIDQENISVIDTVVETASIDHQCPVEQIHVNKILLNRKGFILEVCGANRSYRWFNKVDSFVDTTNGNYKAPLYLSR